jgi:hypothetical protein
MMLDYYISVQCVWSSCFNAFTIGYLKIRLSENARVFKQSGISAPLSIGNYYAKNIHPQTRSDLLYRTSEFAAEQISFVLSQYVLSIYTDRA